MDLEEIKQLIQEQGQSWEQFQRGYSRRLDELEKRMNRPNLGGGDIRAPFWTPPAPTPADELKAAIRGWYPNREPMLADLDPETYASASRKYLRHGIEVLTLDERKAMSVGADPEGGYLVVPTLSSFIVSKVRDLSPVRQFASVQPVGTDRLEGIEDTDDSDSGWVGETQTRSDTTTPRVGKYEIPVHEIYAQPKATQKLIDDSAIDIEGWLVRKVTNRFARQEASAFISGNGVAKPRGILSYATASTGDSSRAWGTLQYVASGNASAFITPTTSASPADCLIDLVYALRAPYRTNARWYMNSATTGRVRKFKDADGRFIWQDPIAEGQPPRLLGYPVSFAEDMPDVGADAFPIAFGDLLQAYQIVDRLGIRVLRDPYTDKPYVKFYSTMRVGGALVNSEAVKLLKIATS